MCKRGNIYNDIQLDTQKICTIYSYIYKIFIKRGKLNDVSGIFKWH